jgi:hypothetical protein
MASLKNKGKPQPKREQPYATIPGGFTHHITKRHRNRYPNIGNGAKRER